jgi:arylsulfatase A-like enzyme
MDATTHDGVVTDPNLAPLADKTVGDDAVQKVQLASAFQARTGRPWFLAAGFRKPHMPWRFPKSFLQYYSAPAEIKLAAHKTMDLSVPPIAHHTPDLQQQAGGDPYHPMPDVTAQWDRLSYYAAVSWVDSQIGRVLDELDSTKATPDTLIVLHSDHGWNLGEHGQWQKCGITSRKLAFHPAL